MRNTADAERATNDQPPTQPPINLTVTIPKPSPEEKAQEEEYRKREVVAAEDVRDFTRLLTFLTFVQAGIGGLGLWAAIRASSAAKKSADAAMASTDALKIIHRQWLRVDSWNCAVESLPGKANITQATVRIAITNTSKLPLEIRTVRCYVNGRKCGHGWSNTTIGPNSTDTESVDHILNQKEVTMWTTERHLRLLVVGWIHYWDAFGAPQEQMIGACCDVLTNGQTNVRGLADLPANLRRMAREDPWPLVDPDEAPDNSHTNG